MKITSLNLFATLIMLPALLSAQIITNPDSVEVYLHQTVLVDVLANDYEISNDSIFVWLAPGYQIIGNRYISVNLDMAYQGKSGPVDTVTYQVRQVNGSHTATGELYITLINESYNILDINNLSAKFYAFGHHFWDFLGSSEFFAPKSTVK